MKALISAAGKGTRLGELTKNTNKCLLKVGGKPLLRHTVEMLKNNGVNDIFVITGYHADKVMAELGDEVKYIHDPHYVSILGSLVLAKEHLSGKDFVFITGDSLIHQDLLQNFLSEKNSDVLASVELKECDEEDYKVILDNHKIVTMSKKIPIDKAHGEYTGMTRFSKESSQAFFQATQEHLTNNSGKVYLAEMLLHLQEKGFDLRPVYTNGIPRIEIDFLHDLENAQKIYFKDF